MTLKQRIGKLLFAYSPITRFLLDQIRFELRAGQVRMENRLLPWHRRRVLNLRKASGVRANIACGPQVLDGFVNLDVYLTRPKVVTWDCRRRLPFGDNMVKGIRVEQFVEHLECKEELPDFLSDCLRVLQPGGVLRIIVPDAERFLHAYCRGDLVGFHELAVPDPLPEDLPTRMDVVNHIFHQWHEHRWAYDFETLAHRLRRVGFIRIERMSYQHSVDPALAQDREQHSPYSLYVDAVK
jgi:predicted SAM-dependent methyltransferase